MNTGARDYLLVSDFDQTLSFNDSGVVLSDMIGISGFRERIAGLADIHLVQQGGELAYLLLHDPEYRRVRREDLVEVGRRVRLKNNIRLLPRLLRENRGAPVFLLRGVRRAAGGDSIGSGGNRAGGAHLRHQFPLPSRHR